MADLKDITKDDFTATVAQGLTMVYYYAPWCKACREMDETLQIALDEVKGKLEIVQVNTDREGDLVAEQNVRVLPTFQVFKNGTLLDAFRGVLSKLELLAELSNIVTEAPAEAAPEQATPKG